MSGQSTAAIREYRMAEGASCGPVQRTAPAAAEKVMRDGGGIHSDTDEQPAAALHPSDQRHARWWSR